MSRLIGLQSMNRSIARIQLNSGIGARNMSRWSIAKTCATFCALVICLGQQAPAAQAANILGIYAMHSPSHLIVHMSVARALAEKGHNITVVCTQKPKVTHESINVIVIEPTEEQDQKFNDLLSVMASQKNGLLTMLKNIVTNFGFMLSMQFDMLRDKRFTALYANPDTKFDLVIIGYFMNDFQLGVAAKFNCPVIVEWTGPSGELVDVYVGNPREMAYVPNNAVSLKLGDRMSFVKRVQNFVTTIAFRGIRAFLDYKMNNYYTQLFPNDGKFPTHEEMKKNVSLVFVNGHFSEGPIRPNVPAMVEIGGIQIKDKPDPLPKDIADFLNSSEKHGAILFSLGSNLKGSHIKPETVDIIFKTLSSLKQNVIWKWDDLDRTPGSSKNILYKKWMPQDDILAHPNLRLFITHAGKGGVAESLYHGVPMVALPVFADQNTNADKLVESGYGLQADMLKLNVADFAKTVHEVLENSSYAANVKEFSKLYRDRPLTAKQTVVFWTEYVLRHHGAAHLQSPKVHLNEFQSANLDVLLFICVVIYVLWKCAKLSFKFICSKLCKKKSQPKKVKKQ